MRVSITSTLILVAMIQPAHAYIDPGTGLLGLHVIVGAVAGGLVTLKLYWRKVKGFFGGGRADTEDDATNKDAGA